jgi:DNA recombination protein RmuC
MELFVWIALIVLAAAVVATTFSRQQLFKRLMTSEEEKNTLQLAAHQKEIELARLHQQVTQLSEQLKQQTQELSQKEEKLREHLQVMARELILQGRTVLEESQQNQLTKHLTPFQAKLDEFQQDLRQTNKENIDQRASLRELILNLSSQHKELHNSTKSLTEALRGDQKTQGDWGEVALKRLLELSGLEEGREYSIQENFKTEEGQNVRPDVILYMPDERHLVIDSKVSLTAYERYFQATDELEKEKAEKEHVISLRNHIQNLSNKSYDHLPGLTSPEFTLMFIPIEGSFSLALKNDSQLYQFAWDKRIVLVTPSTLLATLKTVEGLWKIDRQNRNAELIADRAGKLYDKLVGFLEDFESIRKKQQEAMTAWDNAHNKLVSGKGNTLRQAEQLRELGARTKKGIGKHLLDEGSEE